MATTPNPGLRRWSESYEQNGQTLPRKEKFFSISPSDLECYGKIHATSRELWLKARSKKNIERDGDTFPGLVDVRNWTIYMAPAFGVENETVKECWGTDKVAAREEVTDRGDVIKILDKRVSISSTAATKEPSLHYAKVCDVEDYYGSGQACYIILKDGNQFDGGAHNALAAWIRRKVDQTFDLHNALGFGFQRDRSGHYLRFSSNLNHIQGNEQVNPRFLTFQPRSPKSGSTEMSERYRNRSVRDLPKEWARALEAVLVRELKLSLCCAQRQRIQPAEDPTTSKQVFFTDVHLDQLHPGTVGTENRMHAGCTLS